MTAARRAAAAVVVLLASALPMAAASPAHAGSLPQLRLIRQSAFVSPDGELDLTVRADGDIPADAEVAVTVYQRLRSRSLFNASLAGEPGSTLSTSSTPIADIPRDANADLQLAVPISEQRVNGRLRLRTEGVYPVRIELRDSDGDPLDGFTTHLIRTFPTRDAPPLAVAVILPLDARPGLAPDGSTTLSTAARSRLQTLIAALDRHRSVALTVVPRPETIAALGDTNKPDDLRLRTTLSGALAGRQLVAPPFVAVDAAAMIDGGLPSELTSQVRAGADVLAAALDPARPDSRTWIADGPLTPTALDGLHALGVDQFVLDERALTPLDLSVTLTRPTEVSGAVTTYPSLGAVDPGLQAHFSDTSDPVLGANHLLADLAQLFFDSPGLIRGVVVRPPDGWSPSGPFLDALLDGLVGNPTITPVTVDDYFRNVPRAAAAGGGELVRSLVPSRPASLGDYPRNLYLTQLRLAGYASMVDSGSALVASSSRRLLVASASAISPNERAAYLDAVNALVAQETSRVTPPEHQSVTLTAREAKIPLTIRSTAAYPLKVLIRLSSPKLEFPDGDSQTVVLNQASTTVTFRVRARASGTFPLDIRLTSPDGAVRLADEQLTVRSTAISGVGYILSIGAGLFLAVWWARHLRTTRRARRLVAIAAHPASVAQGG